MQHPLSARRQAPKGVIDTLSAGYAALNRQLWVLLIPIVVDLLLWLGPHVSYSPLVDPTVTRATEWVRQAAVSPTPAVPRRGQLRTIPDPASTTTSSDLTARLEAFRAWSMTRTTDTNALSLLARGPLVVPSLAAPLGAAGIIGSVGALQFVTGWPEGVLLLAVLFSSSLLVGGVFYTGLAASAGAPDRRGPLHAGRRAPRVALRVLGLVASLLGVGVLLGLPVLLLVGFTALVAPELAVLGGVLVLAALLFAEVHLFFAVAAICVSNVGPLAAVQRSVGIVRRHLWPTVGLIVLSWLIMTGLGRVWELLATSVQAPFGVGLAILGNAYIASGLIAAGMIFYTERIESLSPAPSASAPAPA